MSTKPKNEVAVYDFGYYSKLLNKPFDSLEELKKAEIEFKEEQDRKLAAQEEKRSDAKKVEDAYKHLIEVKKEASKAIDEANMNYLKERDAFIEKYGSYHMTFTSQDCQAPSLSINDLFDSLFDAFRLLQ